MYQNSYNGPLKYYKSTQDKEKIEDSYKTQKATSENINGGVNTI
jgi:hypothetical protein